MNVYCIIMAGGAGTRFWPLSRQSRPKQFLDILGTGRTFMQLTYERFAKIVPAENFTVVTNRRYEDLVLGQIPALSRSQILAEPIGRNTAPCIAYAAYSLRQRDPDAVMIVTPSDHLILDEDDFRRTVGECLDFVSEHNALMTVGIRPQHPETGYGYIQVSGDRSGICKVKSFTEKPCLEMAQTFLQTGEFFWNSGIFIWKVSDIIDAFARYMPELHSLFNGIATAFGTEREQDAVERVYSECRSVSIDYGVMEAADNVYVRCGDFGWSDVGTWGSVYRHSRKDRYGNTRPEKKCYVYDTRNSIIAVPGGKLAVVSGLRDYIVVDTDDVLMICPRDEEQNIKKFIDDIKYYDGDEHI